MTKRHLSCFIIPGIRSIIDHAKDLACSACNITRQDLKSKTRKREIVYARFIIMKLLKDYTPMSNQNIGGELFTLNKIGPVKDLNATVIHGIKEIDNCIMLGQRNIKSELYSLYMQAETVFNELYEKEKYSPAERQYNRIKQIKTIPDVHVT